MTHNQIDFASLEETKRHNAAMEKQNADTLAETNRHNVVSEAQSSRQIDVSERQAAVNEAAQAENVRHNLAQEAENVRHNQEQESIGYINAYANMANANTSAGMLDVSRKQLDINQQDATTRSMTQAETSRHNVASESQESAKIANSSAKTNQDIQESKAKVDNMDYQNKRLKSETIKNYVNTITGSYRDLTSGVSNIINSVGNLIGSGSKAIGGLFK